MERISKKTRSKIMSRIRSTETSPEIKLRKELWQRGWRYRKNYRIKGKPDIVFVGRKLVVFVDGCFWHQCPKCYVEPATNKKYWVPKIKRNVERDKESARELKRTGWKVMRFWEHDININLDVCVKKIKERIV